MRERCPHCSKALNGSGECLNCGKSYPAMVGTPMTRAVVKDTVRRMRALRSGSCLGRRHDQCTVSTCECHCHLLSCGSARTHEAHTWTGQESAKVWKCPGHPDRHPYNRSAS